MYTDLGLYAQYLSVQLFSTIFGKYQLPYLQLREIGGIKMSTADIITYITDEVECVETEQDDTLSNFLLKDLSSKEVSSIDSSFFLYIYKFLVAGGKLELPLNDSNRQQLQIRIDYFADVVILC